MPENVWTQMRDMVMIPHNAFPWSFAPETIQEHLLNVDPLDLRNSADFTLLFVVKVEDCSVRIHYEDNRRKGRSWDIPLLNNRFIMFPSTCMYYLTNTQKDSLNFVLTTTYEYI